MEDHPRVRTTRGFLFLKIFFQHGRGFQVKGQKNNFHELGNVNRSPHFYMTNPVAHRPNVQNEYEQ